jgi:hypothetical protein
MGIYRAEANGSWKCIFRKALHNFPKSAQRLAPARLAGFPPSWRIFRHLGNRPSPISLRRLLKKAVEQHGQNEESDAHVSVIALNAEGEHRKHDPGHGRRDQEQETQLNYAARASFANVRHHAHGGTEAGRLAVEDA